MTSSSYPLNNTSSPIGLLRPILLLSIALHGIFLFVPTAKEGKKVDLSLQKEEEIKVTQLPAAPRTPISLAPSAPGTPGPGSTKLPTKPLNVGSLSTVLPNVKSANSKATTTRSTATSATTASQPSTPSSTAKASSPPPAATASQTVATTTSPVKPATPIQSAPQPQSSTPTTTFKSGQSILNPNPKIVAEFNQTLKQLRSDFPNYPTARLGCAGLPSCYRVQADIARIADYLTKGLASKDFEVTPETDEPNQKVYKVSREGKEHTLTILSDGTYTVYMLADAARSFEDIQAAQAQFSEYTTLLNQLTSNPEATAEPVDELAARPDDFAKPELFYKSVKSSEVAETPNPQGLPELNSTTDGNIRLVRTQTPDQVFSSLKTALQTAGFEIEPMKARYGNGALYQVSKDNFRLYLNLVPTKDEQGTIVVTWYASPAHGMAIRNENYFVISNRL
ncbi:hypothetical protein BST81_06980 [Leptolyngbya sp. 'hensonii']|uniref:hypothetical protein n=1 Tax=Leptolyngbya sp. 'hensonii' TaxID=1922337 RepID=UPI00094FBA87|nr:hypothetical protein [Leptolyngbya sp. 'hensonii']OLP18971.1 hypothetical protein BST81_06980 [Leptolyngbya sp. 'hensonii']